MGSRFRPYHLELESSGKHGRVRGLDSGTITAYIVGTDNRQVLEERE